jgi:branched-chain amino acid transport system ATP-binding protein
MLDVRGLEVNYGPIRAVNGIDVSVEKGECVALLGPNGAGKSTTLRAISRLVPHRGTVNFDGQDMRRVSPEAAARLGLVHVPEGRRIFPNLTTHENLLVGLSTGRRSSDGFTVDDVYGLFPALPKLRGRGGWALSGGEQQMVAIGRGLLAGPELLMLDEPSLGLAPVVVREVFGALQQLRGRVAILLVEQSTTMALRLASRAYVISNGVVALHGTASELAKDRGLLASYLGRAPATAPS